ncbi:MAG: urease accessory protein [Chthoniobacter sp.]|nr:urease accessory protein [Chthoniobacter sp.]
MQLIQRALPEWDGALPTLRVPVDRHVLAKRRWRGVAEDGTEFGFDLEAPLADGAPVFQSDSAVYRLAQKYEPVLEVALGADASAAARLGWIIGNLHFPLEVAGATVRVIDDPALRQLFEREGIVFVSAKRVFHPLGGGHHH